MPAEVQTACGVVVGRDYPPPIVDHGRTRVLTLELFKGCA
jgi:deoxyribodipyrimidine photolyase